MKHSFQFYHPNTAVALRKSQSHHCGFQKRSKSLLWLYEKVKVTTVALRKTQSHHCSFEKRSKSPLWLWEKVSHHCGFEKRSKSPLWLWEKLKVATVALRKSQSHHCGFEKKSKSPTKTRNTRSSEQGIKSNTISVILLKPPEQSLHSLFTCKWTIK